MLLGGFVVLNSWLTAAFGGSFRPSDGSVLTQLSLALVLGEFGTY